MWPTAFKSMCYALLIDAILTSLKIIDQQLFRSLKVSFKNLKIGWFILIIELFNKTKTLLGFEITFPLYWI